MVAGNNTNNEKSTSYLIPLFWQHGEENAVLTEEIEQMYRNGIGAFIVESRPHPDFLGNEWWDDLTLIIHEAEIRNMKVWIFDDSAYPSGYCAGLIKEKHPQYLKQYLKECHIDAVGPLNGSSFRISAWIDPEEKLYKIVAAEKQDMMEGCYGETIDITDRLTDGILYWNVPEGKWRIFIFVITRTGGEEWTKDYVNPISREGVRAYIEELYETHYKHFGNQFGKTVAGFFVDEPRFGNAAGYDRKLGIKGGSESYLGNEGMVLPYVDELPALLAQEMGKNCTELLPYLWYGDASDGHDIRYAYMNVVSKLFGECFIGQIGEWCRSHNVDLIGHVVEDNGAHARLGYGSGHFYRSMEGFSAAGFDVVYQIWPEYLEGSFETPFGTLNEEFFYWGLAKMATSAAHMDPKKNGITVCEAFGAYGWQEGLKLMKWLTDHICVRGTNCIIPHAFSPKNPDNDCPPHYYAAGTNPQWKYFHIWADYANRVCGLLTGGIHKATALVMYHAEAEWGGESDPFEKAVRVLQENQIDCDVLSNDYLIDPEKVRTEGHQICINQEKYDVLVVPHAQYLPEKVCKRILEIAEKCAPVFFISALPDQEYYHKQHEVILDQLQNCKNIFVLNYQNLAAAMKDAELYDAEAEDYCDHLRIYHYIKGKQSIYFFTNEYRDKKIHTKVQLKDQQYGIFYDAMEDTFYRPEYIRNEKGILLSLELEPYESVFFITFSDVGEIPQAKNRITENQMVTMKRLDNGWRLESPVKTEMNKTGKLKELSNMSAPDMFPAYSGDFVYTYRFDYSKGSCFARTILDLGEVYESCRVFLNDIDLGVKICPPYRYEITKDIAEKNVLTVIVTNTNAKERGNNIFDRSMPQEPSGLLGPVLIWECRERRATRGID